MRKVKRDVVVDKAKMDEILLSDSTIHWSERNGRRVPVTCGKCGEKRVINLPRGKKRLSLTGFCSKCRNGRAGDEKHSSGTIIHWGERDPENKQKVRITCHHCKSRERFVWTTSARDPNWRGQCDDCNHQRGRPKKFFKEEKLPNGSIFHWTERDPDNFRRVPVTCGKCAEKRVVLIGTRWRGTGLCHKCASPKTFHNDQQVRNTGSIIHWGEVDPADPKRVMVTCGICGIKRSHSKNALLANYKKSKWTGYCRNRYECSQASKNGSEKKNGNGEKRGGGRPPDAQRIENVKDTICEIWDKTKSVRKITYQAIAVKLQLRKDNISSKAVEQRLKRAGYVNEREDVVLAVLKEREKL